MMMTRTKIPTAEDASTTNPTATQPVMAHPLGRSVQFSIMDVDTNNATIKMPQPATSTTAAFNTFCPPLWIFLPFP